MIRAIGSNKTWVVSAAAHGLLFAVAQFGLPHFFDEPDAIVREVPVEVVNIGAMTTPPEPAAPEPRPQPKPAAAPPPPPPQAPPEPPQAHTPEPPAAAAPAPPPLPKPKTAKPPPPQTVKKPPPVPATRLASAAPARKPKPPAPSRDFTSVLKDLASDEVKPAPQPKKAEVTPTKKAETRPQTRSRISDIESITEIDALRVSIRRQIEPCWSPPIGAREAEDMRVTILVYVEPTGQVRRAEVIDAGRMALNPFFEAAADSARRAVLNDRCNPLKDLPHDKYDLWQELELTFNPKDALG